MTQDGQGYIGAILRAIPLGAFIERHTQNSFLCDHASTRTSVIICSFFLAISSDALGNGLRGLTGVEQALGHVRDESTDYEMCQMLSSVVGSCVQSIMDAMPKGWVSEI